ncbi:MAG: tyrosine-type recombinase/integrase [Capsulimonas sp.]|uniref:tyrosine-type recombinase/integrase n=1 Tax=Capsulimonas sp. TaxID=2494211 RepID=UPI003263E025
MKLHDAISDYLNYISVEKGHAKSTCKSYTAWLRHFEKWLTENGYPDADLAAFDIAVLRRYLYTLSGRGCRPRTIRGAFAPIKALGNFLLTNGAIDANPSNALTMPKRDAAQRLTVSTEEVGRLLQAVERIRNPRKKALNRAILSVLVYSGVRAQELLDLEVGHVNIANKTLLVASGKGSKSRQLHPPAECLSALSEWLALREPDCKVPFLFVYDRGRRIGYQTLCQTLEDIKALADLSGQPNIKCHSLRHAFATRMMENGAPIKAIQSAMGHSLTETTFRYLHHAEVQNKLMSEYASLNIATAQDVAETPKAATRRSDFIKRRRDGNS